MEDRLFWELKNKWKQLNENNELVPVMSLPPYDKEYYSHYQSFDFNLNNDLLEFKNGNDYEVTTHIKLYYETIDPRIGYNERPEQNVVGICAFGGKINNGDQTIVNIPTSGSDITDLLSDKSIKELSSVKPD